MRPVEDFRPKSSTRGSAKSTNQENKNGTRPMPCPVSYVAVSSRRLPAATRFLVNRPRRFRRCPLRSRRRNHWRCHRFLLQRMFDHLVQRADVSNLQVA